ncbi:MAG: aminotransferase class I/II-fold pyridoxal phosphate-dependent enzyme [Phycisphaerales bacterium]|nr:aminotransferase class I/II-fold pyridoxal phosphate-dependent enzyme [Phycisphaerales bacterium]
MHAVEAAGFEVFRYKHLSVTDATRLAREHEADGVTIWTDTVFAADGAIARLPGLLDALPQGGGALIADDCHGFCAIGPYGRGAAAYFGLRDPRLMITTTLAKGLGCYGGCVAATRERIASVREHAGIYRGTTPVPPPYAHAARAALRVMQREDGPAERLAENTRLARAGLEALGIKIHSDPVPIMTFTLDPREFQEKAHEGLLRDGILAPHIEYPGGPADRYFRVTVNAAHTSEQIQRLIGAFAGQIRGWHAQSTRPKTVRTGKAGVAAGAP